MSDWSNPVETFAAATVSGASGGGYGTAVTGTAIDYERVQDTHAVQIVLSGFSGSGEIVVYVNASLDGVNWYTLTAPTYTGNGVFLITVDGAAQYVRVDADGITSSGPPAVSATLEAKVASRIS